MPRSSSVVPPLPESRPEITRDEAIERRTNMKSTLSAQLDAADQWQQAEAQLLQTVSQEMQQLCPPVRRLARVSRSTRRRATPAPRLAPRLPSPMGAVPAAQADTDNPEATLDAKLEFAKSAVEQSLGRSQFAKELVNSQHFQWLVQRQHEQGGHKI